MSLKTRRSFEAVATLLTRILLHLTVVFFSQVPQLFLSTEQNLCTVYASVGIAMVLGKV